MKTLIVSVSAALMALSTAAHAQDAYITQLGDDHVAVNYSEYSNGNDNLQVTSQQGQAFQAATFTRGSGNVAHTYQLDTTNGFVNDGNPSGASMQSLIWQSADGYTNGNNNAVAVQLVPQGTQGAQNATFVSQIIQEGNNNTAVNWAQGNSGAMYQQSIGAITTPSIALTWGTSTPATPAVSTGVPYGSSVQVN